MPRSLLYRTDTFAYHVTARSNNKEWFYLPMKVCWDIFGRCLKKSIEKYEVNMHCFVLMSNHFHMILKTPNKNIDDFMRHFISTATQKIQKKSNRVNHIFGARYKWSVLNSAYAFAYAYKYVMRNPIRAKIIKSADEYPWSTFNGRFIFPIVEEDTTYWRFIPKDPKNRLQWLNIPSSKEAEEIIRLALRRTQFKFSAQNALQAHLRALQESYKIELVN